MRKHFLFVCLFFFNKLTHVAHVFLKCIGHELIKIVEVV